MSNSIMPLGVLLHHRKKKHFFIFFYRKFVSFFFPVGVITSIIDCPDTFF